MRSQPGQGQLSMGTCIWQVVIPDMHDSQVHPWHAAQTQRDAALGLHFMRLPVYRTNHPLSLHSKNMQCEG